MKKKEIITVIIDPLIGSLSFFLPFLNHLFILDNGNIASFPKVLLIDELELHLSMSKIKNLCKILYRNTM